MKPLVMDKGFTSNVIVFVPRRSLRDSDTLCSR